MLWSRFLTPIPADSSAVCRLCRSWNDADTSLCSSCAHVLGQLPAGEDRVLPITLYSRPSALREVMVRYKDRDRPSKTARLVLRDVVRAWGAANGDRLDSLTGGWDYASVVPSTDPRRVPHPLSSVMGPSLWGRPLKEVLRRTDAPIGHRQPNVDAFQPARSVAGRRVLLVDDVFTTGAYGLSAARSLEQAGAHVVAILVLARRVNPTFNASAGALWEAQRKRRYLYKLGLAWCYE